MAAASPTDLDALGPQRWLLLCAAAVGGLAGAVMWVAQGVYFTTNALAYDDAPTEATSLVSTRAIRSDCGVDGPLQASSGSSSSKCGGDGGGGLPKSVKVDDNSMADGGGRGGRNIGSGGGGGMAAVNSVVYSGSSITAFAGLFAFAFQLVTTIAKPTAALLLTLYPNRRTILFSVFTGVAALCTLAMMLVAPLNRLMLSKESEEEEVEAVEEEGGGLPTAPHTRVRQRMRHTIEKAPPLLLLDRIRRPARTQGLQRRHAVESSRAAVTRCCTCCCVIGERY